MNAKHETKNILFISASRIGDTLITTPTIRAIANAFPTAKITVYTHPQRRNLLKNVTFINKIKTITKFSANIAALFSKRKYDYAFLFEGDPTYSKLAIKISKKAIAFRSQDDGINIKLYKSVEKPQENIHAVIDKTLLAKSIGVNVDNFRIEYRVTEDENAAAIYHLNQLGIPKNAYIVGLQTTSFHTKPFRNWPIEYFSDLCAKIRNNNSNALFLFFGSKEDHFENQKAVSMLGQSAHNLSGLGLRETAAIMSKCNLLIGVDTGPTHIMGSMNIPMVGIYHCLMPSMLIAPLQHPCFEPVDHCVEEGNCSDKSKISEISVAKVYEAVVKVTNKS